MSDILSIELIQSAQGGGQSNTVSDIAFQNIWLAIVNRDLSSHQIITEVSLAKKYSVSRTPLRAAIQKLIAIGLITRLPNRTMIVTELNIENMTCLSTTRERLEGLIGRNVWDRHKQGLISIASLEKIHESMKKLLVLNDPDLLLSLGIKFHEEMCRLSNNSVAVNFMQQALLALEPYRRLIIGHQERFESIIAEHDEIIQHLKGDDPEAVESLMRHHIVAAREFYSLHLETALHNDNNRLARA